MVKRLHLVCLKLLMKTSGPGIATSKQNRNNVGWVMWINHAYTLLVWLLVTFFPHKPVTAHSSHESDNSDMFCVGSLHTLAHTWSQWSVFSEQWLKPTVLGWWPQLSHNFRKCLTSISGVHRLPLTKASSPIKSFTFVVDLAFLPRPSALQTKIIIIRWAFIKKVTFFGMHILLTLALHFWCC